MLGSQNAWPPLRQEHLKKLYTRESHAIPLTDKFPSEQPCCRIHPGACGKHNVGDTKKILQGLEEVCKKLLRGSFFVLRTVDTHGHIADHYKCLAYNSPLLLARCTAEDGRPSFVLKSLALAFETGLGAVEVLGECARVVLLLHRRQAPTSMQDACSALPLAVGHLETYEQYEIFPKTTMFGVAAPPEVFSKEFSDISELSKKLFGHMGKSVPIDESSDEDVDQIAAMEKKLGSTLRVLKAKAKRKRVAANAKLVGPKAKKHKAGAQYKRLLN